MLCAAVACGVVVQDSVIEVVEADVGVYGYREVGAVLPVRWGHNLRTISKYPVVTWMRVGEYPVGEIRCGVCGKISIRGGAGCGWCGVNRI